MDAHAGTDNTQRPIVVNLLAVDVDGTDGVVWSLPRGGDLNANLVHVAPGGAVGTHVNDDVDVVFLGIAGRGTVSIDAVHHEMQPGTMIAVPKRSERAIAAAPHSDLSYLTVHRARGDLRIGVRRRRGDDR